MDLRPLTLAGLLACGFAAGCNGLRWANNDLDTLLADGPRAAARPFPNAAPVQQSGKPVVIEQQPAAATPPAQAPATQPPAVPAPPTIGQLREGGLGASLTKIPPGRIAPQSAQQPTQQASPQTNQPPAAPPTHAQAPSPHTPPQPAPEVAAAPQEPTVAATIPERQATTEESDRLIAEVAALLQQDQTALYTPEKSFPSHWNRPLSAQRIQREIQLASAEQPDEQPEEEPIRPAKKAAARRIPDSEERPPQQPPEEPDQPTVDELAERVQELRGEMIAALEDLVRSSKSKLSKEEQARLEQELRLAYLAADRLDDAVKKVDALPDAPREAFKHLAFALAQMMPHEDDRRPSHRYARTLRSLREAAQELSAAGKLELKNLAFCESVEQFGWYQEFKRKEFTAGQQVLLYVEVDNVTSERKAPQQFETELQGSYQIFNAANHLVGERTLPLDKETCRNWRRDYFLAYRVYLPEELPPGSYRLELSLEDLKAKVPSGGKKLGEGVLDFTVR